LAGKTSIFVGGGCIDVIPALPVSLEMGPFLVDPGARSRFRFELTLLDQAPPPGADADFFVRHDLVFRLGETRSSAVAYTDGSPGSALAALELALQVALIDDDGLLIHAAAGVVDQRGYLMPGPSGTGKSTAAREAGFDQVLSDERVIVRAVNGKCTLWSTPFWSAGRSLPLCATSAPLDTLLLLEHASTFRRDSWSPDAALTYLMQNIALYEGGAITLRAFELATTLVESTQCARIGFALTGRWPLDSRNAA